MTIQDKALKIAELEGYRLYYPTNLALNDIAKDDAIYKFSSFQGLMEIVFREKVFWIDTTEDTIHIWMPIGSMSKCVYSEEIKEPVEALQDAIIFYYENKEVKE